VDPESAPRCAPQRTGHAWPRCCESLTPGTAVRCNKAARNQCLVLRPPHFTALLPIPKAGVKCTDFWHTVQFSRSGLRSAEFCSGARAREQLSAGRRGAGWLHSSPASSADGSRGTERSGPLAAEGNSTHPRSPCQSGLGRASGSPVAGTMPGVVVNRLAMAAGPFILARSVPGVNRARRLRG
jgi:hypothetical protein